MNNTQQSEPSQFGNTIRKIVIYLNVSAYSVVSELPTLWDTNTDYHISSLSTFIVTVAEFTIFRLLFPGLFIQYWRAAIGIPFFINILISIIFGKSIKKMSDDYNSHYSKLLFYFFFIFLAISVVGFFMIFNDAVGK